MSYLSLYISWDVQKFLPLSEQRKGRYFSELAGAGGWGIDDYYSWCPQLRVASLTLTNRSRGSIVFTIWVKRSVTPKDLTLPLDINVFGFHVMIWISCFVSTICFTSGYQDATKKKKDNYSVDEWGCISIVWFFLYSPIILNHSSISTYNGDSFLDTFSGCSVKMLFYPVLFIIK